MCEARMFFNEWDGEALARDEHEQCCGDSTHKVYDDYTTRESRTFHLCTDHARQLLATGGRYEVTSLETDELVELADLDEAAE